MQQSGGLLLTPVQTLVATLISSILLISNNILNKFDKLLWYAYNYVANYKKDERAA